jgi:hypothetical protein
MSSWWTCSLNERFIEFEVSSFGVRIGVNNTNFEPQRKIVPIHSLSMKEKDFHCLHLIQRKKRFYKLLAFLSWEEKLSRSKDFVHPHIDDATITINKHHCQKPWCNFIHALAIAICVDPTTKIVLLNFFH